MAKDVGLKNAPIVGELGRCQVSSDRRLWVSFSNWIIPCRFSVLLCWVQPDEKELYKHIRTSSLRPCANCSSSIIIVFSTFYATVRLLQTESRLVSSGNQRPDKCARLYNPQRPNQIALQHGFDVGEANRQESRSSNPALHRQSVC